MHRVQEGDHLDNTGRDKFWVRENLATGTIQFMFDNFILKTINVNEYGGVVLVRANLVHEG